MFIINKNYNNFIKIYNAKFLVSEVFSIYKINDIKTLISTIIYKLLKIFLAIIIILKIMLLLNGVKHF